MKNEPIKVMLVDDSLVVLFLLTRILSMPDTGIQIVGTARDGKEGLGKIPLLEPQVICTDLQMPGMDGLEFTREVMAKYPRPILVISSAVEKGKNDDNIFQLLEAGAADVMPKPRREDGNLAEICDELMAKIKQLAGLTNFTGRSHIADKQASGLSSSLSTTNEDHLTVLIPKSAKVIAIGASTGGPRALHKILSGLSPQLSIPLVCVQHVSQGFTEDLVDWLNMACPLEVRIANIGEPLSRGTVYFPPDTSYLVLDDNGRCNTTPGTITSNNRLSITSTFNSIAKYYGEFSVGILLTGMGSDGSEGLLNIHKAGGFTIAEDESSCVSFAMPKSAIDIGAAKHVLPLAQITKILGDRL